MSWIIQYRRNSSTPSWFNAEQWRKWLEPVPSLDALVAKFEHVMTSDFTHASWKGDGIEYQFVEQETGEIIPWTLIAGS